MITQVKNVNNLFNLQGQYIVINCWEYNVSDLIYLLDPVKEHNIFLFQIDHCIIHKSVNNNNCTFVNK